jgi:DAK2 domain fusion protein YloV
MTVVELLSADDLRAAMLAFRDALKAHRDIINRLNVYPVPDGDTGTNMSLTLDSVVAELDGADADVAAVCGAISHGSLMGARGNSGVILSQILRELAATLRAADARGGLVLADALTNAADAAYGAVSRPVEGTILTVMRAVAEGATATGSDSLVEVLEAGRERGHEALRRTPELLPVLAEAGVVDSGGTGLMLLVDALLTVVDGRPLPVPDPSVVGAAQVHLHPDHQDHDAVADLRYEVMYFLDAPDEAVPGFRDVWAGIGDSIVVVGGDGIWNCHIHTDDIGAAIEAALDIGRPSRIRVTDLLEEVEEERWVREAGPSGSADDASPHTDPVPTAVVAVATGDGVRRIFHSLGVQQIVTGGQTMNPSTAQLLEAVERAPADEVVILPNNSNIIPVAIQVDDHTSKIVHVVPTRGVAEGFACLLSYDPEASAADNAKAMAEAADAVVAGEVTRAVRDSSCELGPIEAGQWIGIAPDGIRAISNDLGEACIRLLDHLIESDHEIASIIEGEGSSSPVTRHITQWLADHRPDCAAEVHHGGQPLYPYLFGIE